MDSHSPSSGDDGSHGGEGESGDGLELHFDGWKGKNLFAGVEKGVWFGV